ncbi:MAG TPA: zf-HC2 domain-containing protein [Thermoanaerobaculia bacterium]
MNDEELDRHARAVAAQLEPEHPDLETELFPYAEGTLPREQAAEIAEHVMWCARCREDVEDARALAPLRPRRASRAWLPLAAAAMIGGVLFLFVTRDDAPPPSPVQTATVITQTLPTPTTTTASTAAVPRYARAEWETLVRETRAGLPLAVAGALAPLRRDAYVLRGGEGGGVTLEPSGVIVESPRPKFRWSELSPRAVVTVFADDAEVARSAELSTNEWTPRRDLPRGVTLTWQVELRRDEALAIIPAPPAPPARFRIVDAETAAELEEARRAHPDDALLLGLLYARAGLVDDARLHFERVQNPADLPLARRLLRQLPA